MQLTSIPSNLEQIKTKKTRGNALRRLSSFKSRGNPQVPQAGDRRLSDLENH
ncbi:MAG: hypothetical protein ACK6CP_23565 [Pseudanabaena sp.]|nr:hypothetical protein [Pseudanabaena sp. M090S1SP2A07QC]MCA6505435.1 hypothetical protein [Pseudanabaena sp. M172S2SP2A07QC]MCA6509995.1 hypothetical protein [Pseudanabaena sp. M109S1SP2A07QC]MCA6519827.1 hypothetical protein [Pseudanabaena sp. M110S1SP2A07QC]MCA6523294.1 hypothetical protein [Pseudanabaena sp. M051S1SP2A07QC]MCA6526053.1 hypothetical protein [Pseudanabaena sp. M179S2SP2A07QC]MCA6528995.1 hypothetical protein [Pseudanabaena sp. M125S2SP2A07QC]MCA6535337.1 hypothetical prot